MRKKSLLIVLTSVFIALCGVQPAKAQMLEPVKWSFKTNRINDTIAELQYIATIDQGWHLYSQHLPENGPLPLEFKFDKISGVTLIGKVAEPKSHEEYDAMFEMKVKFFEKKAVFTQKVKITSNKPVTLKGVM